MEALGEASASMCTSEDSGVKNDIEAVKKICQQKKMKSKAGSRVMFCKLTVMSGTFSCQQCKIRREILTSFFSPEDFIKTLPEAQRTQGWHLKLDLSLQLNRMPLALANM